MKFRKVGTSVATSEGTAVGQWTKSSVVTDNTGGCAVATLKHHRVLPVTHTIATDVEDRSNGDEVRREEKEPTDSKGVEEAQQVEAMIPEIAKPKDVQYTPEERNAPPKAVIDHFFNQTMEQGEDGSSDQRELVDAGLLSLEDVLLPAIAHQENQALKKIQRKVQRDAPDQTHILIAGRTAVNKSLGAAALAVRQSRAARRIIEQQREETWAQERRVQREERRKDRAKEVERLRSEAAKAKELQKLKDKREQKKKFGPNQDLWREVAYLMTESSKLEREGRLWREAEAMFEATEKDLESREATRRQQEESSTATTTDDAVMEDNDENMEPHPTVNMQPFDRSIEDIMKSSGDIQAALKLVTETMADAGKLRKNLYRRYRQDHQFEGYRGVNDPKGLIRILSQDTEA